MASAFGNNCDGQEYTPELSIALVEAFQFLSHRRQTMLTCWCPEYLRSKIKQIVDLDNRAYADHDALLLHNRTQKLAGFYRTLIRDDRKKILVAPSTLHRAIYLLKCDQHIEVPRPNAFSVYKEILKSLLESATEKCIFLFCAGPAAKPWIAELLQTNDLLQTGKEITCLDLGSALDPLYIGNTRTGQPSRDQAMSFFEEVANAA